VCVFACMCACGYFYVQIVLNFIYHIQQDSSSGQPTASRCVCVCVCRLCDIQIMLNTFDKIQYESACGCVCLCVCVCVCRYYDIQRIFPFYS